MPSFGFDEVPAGSDVKIRPEDFNRIAQELRKGNAVLVSIKFPGSTNHVFVIEARGHGTAGVLHAWQGNHQLKVERAMPIDEMVGYLKRFPELDWVNNKPELPNVRHQLCGADHAEVPDITTSANRRISYEMPLKGKPDLPFTSPENGGRLTSLCGRELAEWQSSRSSTSGLTEWRSACSRASQIGWQEGQQRHGGVTVRWGAGVDAGIGFVFGAGGVLLCGLVKRKQVNHVEVALGGLKGGLAGDIGGGADAAIARAATPALCRIGISVVRANAVAGFAMFGILALWHVAQWKMNKITEVELRQGLAEDAAAAGGAIAGGSTLAVGLGIWFGPIGAVVGAIGGGIVGGIGGMFAGRAIDKAIWDKGEDAVMNSYEYFGWHDVKRNTRPTKSADQISKAYGKKLRKKPKKIKDEDWHKCCSEQLKLLLPAMYPEFKKKMLLIDKLKEKKSRGLLTIIVTAVYEYFYQE